MRTGCVLSGSPGALRPHGLEPVGFGEDGGPSKTPHAPLARVPHRRRDGEKEEWANHSLPRRESFRSVIRSRGLLRSRMPTVIKVGGLLAVGFDAAEELLLVVTHNGRAVYRVSDGSRVARSAATGDPWDGEAEEDGAAGIGPLQGVRVPVKIFGGGELRFVSPSGRYAVRCTAQEVEIGPRPA